MSFYILPKINNSLEISLVTNKNNLLPYISSSLLYHINDIKKQICIFLNDIDYQFDTIDQLTKLVNPYEFIFSKLLILKYSISKLTPYSNTFYDLFEICYILNLSFSLSNMKTLHIGCNNKSSIEYLNMFRELNKDIHYEFNSLDDDINVDFEEKERNSIDYIYFDELNYDIYKNTNRYVIGIIHCLIKILKYQKNGGICIIKVSDIIYKPIVDIIYILCNLYEKICLIKPNTSDITSSEKYIVCEYFHYTSEKINEYYKLLMNIIKNNNIYDDTNIITSILNNEIHYFFKNKL